VLLAAALVPGTALVVPGAAGRAEVLADVRADVLEALGRVLATGPREVVVVAPARSDRTLDHPGRPTLAAAGIPDAVLGWPPAGDDADAVTGAPPGVPASVAMLALARAGWTGPVRVAEVGSAGPGSRLRSWGAAIDAGDVPTVLVVVGSLSARHGPDAPLADDERALPYDAAVLAAIGDGGPAARAALAALTAQDAQELAVTGWGPWQVLLGATGSAAVEARVLGAAVPYGAQHVVATWVLTGGRQPGSTQPGGTQLGGRQHGSAQPGGTQPGGAA